MYLVSATLGSYSSTDYLHFVANERKKNITLNEIKKKKKKKKCASRYGLKGREGTTCQFLLNRPVLLIYFSVASIIVLFIRTVNLE